MWGTFVAVGGVTSPARTRPAGTAAEISVARVRTRRFIRSLLGGGAARRGSGGASFREVAGLDDRDFRRIDVLAHRGENLFGGEGLDLFLERRVPGQRALNEEILRERAGERRVLSSRDLARL